MKRCEFPEIDCSWPIGKRGIAAMNSINEPGGDASIIPTDPLASDWHDPVIAAYKKDVDRTLLRENLKLTVEQRIQKAESVHRSLTAWREAGRRRIVP
jgi:hypothetical protein